MSFYLVVNQSTCNLFKNKKITNFIFNEENSVDITEIIESIPSGKSIKEALVHIGNEVKAKYAGKKVYFQKQNFNVSKYTLHIYGHVTEESNLVLNVVVPNSRDIFSIFYLDIKANYLIDAKVDNEFSMLMENDSLLGQTMINSLTIIKT